MRDDWAIPMKLRIVFLLLLATPLTFAAERDCVNGRGGFKLALPDDYAVQVAPAPDGKCIAALLSPAGDVQFSATGEEARINFTVTGRDINADSKNDALLETVIGGKHHYAVLTPGATPPLVREIVTNEPLEFGDRLGSGKIEIFGREQVFVGIDGLPQDETPAPLAIFRMSGTRIYPVMNLFWPEYEA